MGGLVGGWMGGWVGGKASLRIAYSNQKFLSSSRKCTDIFIMNYSRNKFDNRQLIASPLTVDVDKTQREKNWQKKRFVQKFSIFEKSP